MVPCQGRHSGASVDRAENPANGGVHTNNVDDGNQPSLYAAARKADVSTKVGQSSRHWSRHTAKHCNNFLPLGTASLSRHRDTTSTASSFVIDLCEERDTTLGIACFRIFRQVSGNQRQLCVSCLFASVQSMHHFEDSFLSCQPSRLVSVWNLGWTAKNDQQVRCFVIFTTVLLDHTGEKPLVLFSEDSLTVLVFTVYVS